MISFPRRLGCGVSILSRSPLLVLNGVHDVPPRHIFPCLSDVINVTDEQADQRNAHP